VVSRDITERKRIAEKVLQALAAPYQLNVTRSNQRAAGRNAIRFHEAAIGPI
jgi:hypothetical protein